MIILETERLILREIVAADDAFMVDLLNQPSFIKYIGDRQVRTLEQARDFIENRYRQSYRDHGFGLYAVELKQNASEIRNPAIGICGFVKRDSLPGADIGFAFLPQYERKGYAFESASAVLKWGRETLGFDRVLAITSLDNDASIRLLEKLGFRFEGIIEGQTPAESLRLFSSEK
ncbi:MAG: GNAT family N-acetyltransferase [Acidobacteria bacterium]|nr:GNAT family N-acetyltransferase [Acidobacteriota bacterium]